jgi:anti-sigma factor ChrR (cupin superfamily)
LKWTESAKVRLTESAPRTACRRQACLPSLGASISAHSHTRAEETVYVLEGDFVEDGVAYGAGSFFAGAAGIPHGPHRTVGGCVLLTTFSGPLDFVLAE